MQLRNLDQPLDDTIDALAAMERAPQWDSAAEQFVSRLDFEAIEAANQPIRRAKQ